MSGPVTISGLGTRGGAVPGVRAVRAPSGIAEYNPAEMTLRCGAGTTMAEIEHVLSAAGQYVALSTGGTVGGALATGASDLRRLGRGAARDTVLQARYITAGGTVAKAGGPTVKNVSGFDLCRLLVGSHGALGFLGEVILRTKPSPAVSRWFAGAADPDEVRARLYRPAAVLWDGMTTWICLEGHPADVQDQAALTGLLEVDGPPSLPSYRRSVPLADTRAAVKAGGSTIAALGLGVVYSTEPSAAVRPDPRVRGLHRQLQFQFDPTGRLNPGRFPLISESDV